MKEWTLTHPYLTFILLVLGIVTASSSFDRFLELFRKPTERASRETDPTPGREDLN